MVSTRSGPSTLRVLGKLGRTRSVKKKFAPGPYEADGIHLSVLKDCAVVQIRPLKILL